jgi:hypothetical protein
MVRGMNEKRYTSARLSFFDIRILITPLVSSNSSFRLLTDFVYLYTYEFWLSLCKIARSSVILLLPLIYWNQMLNVFVIVCSLCLSGRESFIYIYIAVWDPCFKICHWDYICAFHNPESLFLTSYAVVFLSSTIWGERWLLIFVELLTITS